MIKVLRPTKDTYINDRIIDGTAQLTSNVGMAGSLDLFKLYGFTSTLSGSTQVPNVELSRLLLQFDLDPLRELVSSGAVDVNGSSFSCKLLLHDVDGGQPVPNNFTLCVNPLSASFDEGLGHDVVLYSDYDACNWLTSSLDGSTWHVTGCGLGGDGSTSCDYITASISGSSLTATQFFTTGEEDLNVDVTAIVSSTLAGTVPDVGLRISFSPQLEANQYTYFVKRFAGRTAYNEDLRPKLVVTYDDSVQDDTDNVYLDSPSYLFLYNYVRSSAANLMSGSSQITGSNCLILTLQTPVSGGTYSLYFTGSQHSHGTMGVEGVYSCSVLIPSNDPTLLPQLQQSGSITFTPTWGSLDGTVPFLTGSTFVANPPQRGSRSLALKNYVVSVQGVTDSLLPDELTTLRINIFDYTSPYVTSATRLPVDTPGIIVRDVHYQVRDVSSGHVVVPFDLVGNSTRVSNDSSGMYFVLDASNLTEGRTYVIDVQIITDNNKQLHKAASPQFRVEKHPRA